MTEYTIDMIKGTTVMEQMRSLIKVVIEFINNADYDELRQMIQTEIADRTAQDSELNTQIEHEAEVRASQDAMVQQTAHEEIVEKVGAEAEARESQDNSLQSQIQAETVQRIDADDTLQADIQQEQQIREQSDGNIETSLQTEISQRQYEDTQLRGDLESEQRSRQNQDTQLDTAIQNEASQRASADSGLNHNITDLTTRVGTVETSVADIISGSQVVGAAQNQGHADTQSEAQVGDHIVSTTANIGDDTHPVKIVNGVPVQVNGELQGKLTQGTGITIDANNEISQSGGGGSKTVHNFTTPTELYNLIKDLDYGTECVLCPSYITVSGSSLISNQGYQTSQCVLSLDNQNNPSNVWRALQGIGVIGFPGSTGYIGFSGIILSSSSSVSLNIFTQFKDSTKTESVTVTGQQGSIIF